MQSNAEEVILTETETASDNEPFPSDQQNEIDFKEFLADRDVEKKILYSKIVICGWSFFGLGILGGLICTVFTVIFSQTYIVAIPYVTGTLGTSFAILGLGIFRSVPVEELNVDDCIDRYPNVAPLAVGFLVILGIIYGIGFTVVPPFSGILMVAVSLWVFVQPYLFPILGVALRLSIFVSVGFIPPMLFLLYIGIDPKGWSNAAIFDGLAYEEYTDQLKHYHVISLLVFSIQAGILFVAFLCCVYALTPGGIGCFSKSTEVVASATQDAAKEKEKKYCQQKESTILYKVIWFWFITIGCLFLFGGIMKASFPSTFNTDTNWGLQLCIGLSLCTSCIVLQSIGNVKMFKYMARKFELDLKRLQMDGACMSILVKSFQNHDDKVLWVQRSNPADRFKNEKPGDISRRFYMKGSIEKVTPEMVATVSFDEDEYIYWTACYEDSSLVYHNKKHKKFDYGMDRTERGSEQMQQFDEWVSKNFEEKDGVKFVKDSETFSVTVTFPTKKKAANEKEAITNGKEATKEATKDTSSKNREELLKTARKTLRKYTWDPMKFEFDLLKKSPREMGDIEEKTRVYELGTKLYPEENEEIDLENVDEKVKVYNLLVMNLYKKIKYTMKERVYNLGTRINAEHEKIDYFISHSWNDDAVQKHLALKQFAEEFNQRNNRYPTFWFDKICIDQQNSADGISVLPINIGACSKMLILLGNTYLERLWCIWELFTLFTFCNKELALERISIVCMEGFNFSKALKSFDEDNITALIGNSHCFDPNEEYKLRRIMLKVIDEKVLRNTLDAMRQLDSMGKVFTLNKHVMSLPTTSSSSNSGFSQPNKVYPSLQVVDKATLLRKEIAGENVHIQQFQLEQNMPSTADEPEEFV